MNFWLPLMFAVVVIGPQDVISTGAEAVGDVLQGRSESLVILVGMLILAGLYVWFVAIPNRNDQAAEKLQKMKADQEARRREDEIKLMQAKAISELAGVTTDIQRTTKRTRDNTGTLLEATRLEFRALRKINELMNDVDISDELAKAEGLIDFARRQQNDS